MFNESNESTIENDIELRENCFKIKRIKYFNI